MPIEYLAGWWDMEELYAAKYNIYWYLSFAAPVALMLFATFWNKKWILVLVVVVSLFVTSTLRVQAVIRKWHLRNQMAVTPEEKAYAQADGANLLFESVFLAPYQAILCTVLWGLLGRSFWRSVRSRNRRPTASKGNADLHLPAEYP